MPFIYFILNSRIQTSSSSLNTRESQPRLCFTCDQANFGARVSLLFVDLSTTIKPHHPYWGTGRKPETSRDLQSPLSCAFASSWFHVMPILLVSARSSQRLMPLALPLLLSPGVPRLCMSRGTSHRLRKRVPYPSLLLPISRFAGIYCVLSHRLILLILSSQCTLRISQRQLLLKVCSLLTVALFIPHVSAP